MDLRDGALSDHSRKGGDLEGLLVKSHMCPRVCAKLVFKAVGFFAVKTKRNSNMRIRFHSCKGFSKALYSVLLE